MKLFYTTDFAGHYPVGTSAICWAENEDEAYQILERAIMDKGLSPQYSGGFTVQEFTTEEKVIVLQDGDY